MGIRCNYVTCELIELDLHCFECCYDKHVKQWGAMSFAPLSVAFDLALHCLNVLWLKLLGLFNVYVTTDRLFRSTYARYITQIDIRTFNTYIIKRTRCL